MRKNRVIEQNRCYHLVSRLAHRAFFLDDEEKDRAVALMRRVGVQWRCRAGRSASPFRSKADPRLDIPDKVGIGLGKGSERTARRILELLAGGPMSPSALREAVGIKSRIHFSRYYMTPLMEKGLVERTDPENPMSPRQEYKLA